MATLDREIARMRRHREEMQLALREGLTLDAARARLFALRDRARRQIAEARRASPAPPVAAPAARPHFWYDDL